MTRSLRQLGRQDYEFSIAEKGARKVARPI